MVGWWVRSTDPRTLFSPSRHAERMRTNVQLRADRDAAGALDRGMRRYMLDGAQKGFNVSQEHVPHGATSFLANQSAQEPTVMNDGTVWWGYLADYARYVEEGTAPHWIPLRAMDSLRRWARRVLGDESAAWAVRHSIAEEGTDPQPYVEPGVKAMRDWFRARDPATYMQEELGE